MVKRLLEEAGIDTKISAYSVRGDSSSTVSNMGITYSRLTGHPDLHGKVLLQANSCSFVRKGSTWLQVMPRLMQTIYKHTVCKGQYICQQLQATLLICDTNLLKHNIQNGQNHRDVECYSRLYELGEVSIPRVPTLNAHPWLTVYIAMPKGQCGWVAQAFYRGTGPRLPGKFHQ